MKWKKAVAGICAGVLTVGMLSGCGAGSDVKQTEQSKANASETVKESAASGSSDAASADAADIEWWGTNDGYLGVEVGSETYNFYKNLTGVGIYQPYVEWNGGTT